MAHAYLYFSASYSWVRFIVVAKTLEQTAETSNSLGQLLQWPGSWRDLKQNKCSSCSIIKRYCIPRSVPFARYSDPRDSPRDLNYRIQMAFYVTVILFKALNCFTGSDHRLFRLRTRDWKRPFYMDYPRWSAPKQQLKRLCRQLTNYPFVRFLNGVLCRIRSV